MNDVRIAMLGSGFVAEFYMQGLANVNGHKVVSQLFARCRAARNEFRRTLVDSGIDDGSARG